MIVREIYARSILSKSKVFDYVVNPYIGCQHGCAYCYARFMKRFTGHKEPWGEFVDVKINAAHLLQREIEKMPPGRGWVSGVCDPYQPLERTYEVTRKCLEILVRHDWPITIQTKSALVLRDVELFKEANKNKIEVGLTVTTGDEGVRQLFEPGAPSIKERIKALEELHLAGIRTYAMIAPMLPGAEELAAVASALSSNFTKLIQHPGKVSGNVMDGGQLWSSEYTITVNPELSERNDSARLEPVDPYLARNLLVNLSAEFPEFSEIKDWRELTRENITEQIINRLNLVAHRRCFKEYSDVDQSFLEVNHSTSSIADNTPNIDSLIDSFMEHKRASGNSSAYLYSLERKLRVFAGYHTGLPVHPELIEKYLSRFSNETATGQDAWKVLSMFYGFAEKRFGVNNPMGDVRKPKYKRKSGQRMSREQAIDFMKVIETALDWALVVCYFGLRLRRSEACRLYFRDIKDNYFVVHGKERTEELPLLPSFRDILLKLQNGRSLDSAVFSGKNGPLHSDTLATHIEQLFKKAGIEGVRCSPHTLRNTAGRLWLVYGGDQGSNRQLLRHSTQTMTDHYSELNPKELMEKERRHNPMLHLMHELGHEVPELLSSGPDDWDIQNTTGR